MTEGRIVPLKGSIRGTISLKTDIKALLKLMYPNMPIHKKILIKLYFFLDSVNKKLIEYNKNQNQKKGDT
jgi:hypothetical protein